MLSPTASPEAINSQIDLMLASKGRFPKRYLRLGAELDLVKWSLPVRIEKGEEYVREHPDSDVARGLLDGLRAVQQRLDTELPDPDPIEATRTIFDGEIIHGVHWPSDDSVDEG